MTLEQALRALHEAGRIRSPWREGMRFGAVGRVSRVVSATECLWDRPGTVVVDRLNAQGRWVKDTGSALLCAPPSGEPDLTDPATVGCLLALLREAEGDPGITTRAPTDPHGGNWYVHVPIEDTWATDSGAPTEGEAIAAALIALAEPR